jgi:hypothetical protein
MNAFSQLLDLELERCGWTAANKAFDDMISACRARDDAAYDAAKARFDECIQKSTREAGSPNKQPAANNGHSA